MFTGLIEETGRVASFAAAAGGAWRLRVASDLVRQGLALGDSVAVDGCCLTATQIDEGHLAFDVLEETRRCTHFDRLRPGAPVNLERSLRFNGSLGGHFVTGHVDAVGEIESFEPRGADHHLRIRADASFGRYLVPKGGVAVDGISLTLAEVAGGAFGVWIIPHTLQATGLRNKKRGDPVNLEFDILAKYVEKLMAFRPAAAP